jgi:predicted kinase
VLRYYMVYRALVRAMVANLRAPGAAPAGAGSSSSPDYLALADRLSQPARPWLAITRGLSGSGKSVFAARLLESGGAIRLRADAVRKRLFGLAPDERSAQRIPGGIYGQADTARTYQRLHALAETALAAGWPTVVDATFLLAAQREPFQELAGAHELPFAIADCQAPVELLRARIAARSSGSDPSEADLAVLDGQLARNEAVAANEADLVFAVDGQGDAAGQADRLGDWLHAAAQARETR